MEATELLKQQHDEVNALFEQYEAAEDSDEKQELFEQIADDLAAHTAIEEKIFYPAVYVGEELQDKLREAVEEHLAAKRIIADLLEMEPTDGQFDAKMKVLKEEIEHHVEEEEGDLFKKVKAQFSKEELESLGTEMERMFDELQESDPRAAIPGETDEAAPLS